MASWVLDDARQHAAQYPYTYYKADDATIGLVAVGEFVKLSFRIVQPLPNGPGAERMWVKVESIGPGDHFVGSLGNAPKYIRDIALGDRVEFQRDNIVNTQHDPANSLVDRLMAGCQVTKCILDGQTPIGFIFRMKPMGPEDSGWRIFTGTESREYMLVKENVVFTSLGSVMNVDNSVLHLLGEPVGAEFVFDPTINRFRKND